MEEVKRTRVKKEKILSLTENVRLYISSLSARNAKYLYLNILEDKYSFILSNADYAMLSSFIPHILALHLVQLKPSEYQWFDHFKSILKMMPLKPIKYPKAKNLFKSAKLPVKQCKTPFTFVSFKML